MQIVLCDEQPMVRLGMRSLIKEYWSEGEVSAVSQENELHLVIKEHCKLLIINLREGAAVDLSCLTRLHLRYPKIPLLAYSSLDESKYTKACMKLGASGFLSRRAGEQEILVAISALLSGGNYISQLSRDQELIKDQRQDLVTALSTREIQVANLLLGGWGVAEIARNLEVSITTVCTYKTRIFVKLGIKNILALAAKMGAHRLL